MALSFHFSPLSLHQSLRSAPPNARSHLLSPTPLHANATLAITAAFTHTSNASQWSSISNRLWPQKPGLLSPPLSPLTHQSWRISAAAALSHDPDEEEEEEEEEEADSSFFAAVSKTASAAVRDLTPLKVIRWATYLALISMSIRWICNTLVFNPTAWMFGSWVLVMWPWPAALIMGFLALHASWKHYKGKASKFEQFLILAGLLVWMILVPLAHVHGFVDGWPLTLFFLYTFFFLINPIVRARLYDDLTPPPEFQDWDDAPPRQEQIAFVVAAVVSHLLAALEAPPILYSWNWQWQTKLAAVILLLAVVLQWSATAFLGKYSNKLAKPRAVVMFGPYRFVRHPIYSSYMLLFAGYCLSLRSYASLAILILASIVYYDRRAKKEEHLLEERFGKLYTSYRERVVNKYLPWVY